MARNFRELFRWLLPSWLTEGEGGLVAYSLATLKDIYLERVYQGLVARFPSYSAGDALAEIGRERGLKQGSDESQESYVERLQAWRVPKTHRVRGTAFEALRQAQIAAGPGTYVRTIDAQGTEHIRLGDGTESYSYGNAWAWAPADAAPSAALDPEAGADVADILIGTGPATLTLHCDGTPGRLLFVHVNFSSPDSVSMPPGWALLFDHGLVGLQDYREQVYWRLVEADAEPFTTVAVTCTNSGIPVGARRFIGRAVNVTASTRFPSNPIVASGFAAADTSSATITPVVPHGSKALVIFFGASRLTTYNFSGMQSAIAELGAERTAGGPTGIAIAEAMAAVDLTARAPNAGDVATLTLGTVATLLTSYVTVVEQGPAKAQFWLELRDVPGATANSYSKLAGDLWTDPEGNETLGMAGVTPRKASDLRDLFLQAPAWKPAGTRAMWAIFNLTGAPVVPDPTWAYWSDRVGATGSSVQTPNRDPAFRYVQLTVVGYADRRQWVDLVPLLDGTLYAGVAVPFAFNGQTLPKSKRLYSGNPDRFPTGVRLPDDGDQISGVL